MEKDQASTEEHGEEAAASTDETEEEQAHAQDGTDSTFFDTDQHSDAPGPFGTGEE